MNLLLIDHDAGWYAIIARNDTVSLTHQFPAVQDCIGGLDGVQFVATVSGTGLPANPESDPNVPHDC